VISCGLDYLENAVSISSSMSCLAYIFDQLFLKHTSFSHHSLSMDKKVFRFQQVGGIREGHVVKIEYRVVEIRTWTTTKNGYEADNEGRIPNSFIERRILKSSERTYESG